MLAGLLKQRNVGCKCEKAVSKRSKRRIGNSKVSIMSMGDISLDCAVSESQYNCLTCLKEIIIQKLFDFVTEKVFGPLIIHLYLKYI